MVSHQYYLHFQEPPPANVIDSISAQCSDMKQVFDTSYLLLSILSLSKMKFFLKSMHPMPHHFLALIKAGYEAYSLCD